MKVNIGLHYSMKPIRSQKQNSKNFKVNVLNSAECLFQL